MPIYYRYIYVFTTKKKYRLRCKFVNNNQTKINDAKSNVQEHMYVNEKLIKRYFLNFNQYFKNKLLLLLFIKLI